MNTQRTDYTAGLRRLADIIDANPGMELPFDGIIGTIHIFCADALTLAATVKAFGAGRKTVDHSGNMTFIPNIGLDLHVTDVGGVCELIDTGETEEYDEEVTVTEAVTETVTRTRVVMERRCPDSILALANG